MRLDVSQHGAVTVLKPCGSIALEDAEQFRTALEDNLETSHGRFVVDFASTLFIDSIGLEAIVDMSDQLSERGQGLRVCGVTSTLAEVFDLTGISPFLDRYEEATSAVRSFL